MHKIKQPSFFNYVFVASIDINFIVATPHEAFFHVYGNEVARCVVDESNHATNVSTHTLPTHPANKACVQAISGTPPLHAEVVIAGRKYSFRGGWSCFLAIFCLQTYAVVMPTRDLKLFFN